MATTITTKEYVDGGMNIITTITEFIPTDVIQSRAILAKQDLDDAQEAFDVIQIDLSALPDNS